MRPSPDQIRAFLRDPKTKKYLGDYEINIDGAKDDSELLRQWAIEVATLPTDVRTYFEELGGNTASNVVAFSSLRTLTFEEGEFVISETVAEWNRAMSGLREKTETFADAIRSARGAGNGVETFGMRRLEQRYGELLDEMGFANKHAPRVARVKFRELTKGVPVDEAAALFSKAEEKFVLPKQSREVVVDFNKFKFDVQSAEAAAALAQSRNENDDESTNSGPSGPSGP